MAAQSDEVIWQIINHQFCSFKAKLAQERTFCQNPYNVTGLCLRSACPLANSQYATIREEDGVCYLFIKTAERAHTPKHLWEKIKLPASYMKALDILSTQLEHFPKYLVHRNKQRLTKIHQMLIRMRKLKLQARPKIVTTNSKVDKREVLREKKALKAAQLEQSIEKELLERLRQVSESEIYNYPEKQYSKVLNKASASYDDDNEEEEESEYEDEDVDVEVTTNKTSRGKKASKRRGQEEEDEEEEEDVDYARMYNRGSLNNNEDDSEDDDDDEEEEEGEDIDSNYNVQFVEDFEESDEEDIEDSSFNIPVDTKKRKSSSFVLSSSSSTSRGGSGDGQAAAKKNKSKSKGARIEIEYEDEQEDRVQEVSSLRAAAGSTRSSSSRARGK